MKTFQIYTLSNFQVYSRILLTIITCCALDPQNLLIFSNWKFVPSNQYLPNSPTPSLGNHYSTL